MPNSGDIAMAEIKRTAIEDLRRDAATIDRAADIIHKRGPQRMADQLRKKAQEWMDQSDEMEKR